MNVLGNIIGSGTALTNLNYNAILNPPTLVSFNNPSTFVSTINISGNTKAGENSWFSNTEFFYRFKYNILNK